MFYLTVDLASKFTAAMVTDEAGVVHREWDSRDLSHFAFSESLRQAVVQYDPAHVLIEDVPYSNKFTQAMTKAVTRFQGIIIRDLADHLDRVRFINPSTWQKDYPGVGSAPKGLKGAAAEKSRIEAAAAAARDRGYTPPDLVALFTEAQAPGTRILKKHTASLTKNMTDYVDAFLMSDWLRNHQSELDGISGVQPVMI